MGRGRGPIQKAIMGTLRSYPNVSSNYIARFIHKVGGGQPTPSQLSAVYKALQALEAQGAIKRSPIPTTDGDRGWVLAVEPVRMVPLKAKAKGVK